MGSGEVSEQAAGLGWEVGWWEAAGGQTGQDWREEKQQGLAA